MESSAAVVEFSGEQAICNIDDALSRLQAALDASGDVEIDLAGVASIDVSFIQLLLAARRSARRDGKGLRLQVPVPAAVADCVVAAGLARDSWFGPAGPG